MKLPFAEIEKTARGASLGRSFLDKRKVKIPVRHLVEKPVCCWTYRSSGGEVQAGDRNVGDFSV